MHQPISIDLTNGESSIVKIQGFDFSLFVADLELYNGQDELGRIFDPILDGMEQGHIAMWGAPERDFRILVTSDRSKIRKSKDSIYFMLNSSGRLCLGDGGDVMGWAVHAEGMKEYPEVPVDENFEQFYLDGGSNTPVLIKSPTGPLDVSVHLFFRWEHGAQVARMPFRSPDVAVLIQEASSFESEKHDSVPWKSNFRRGS